MKDGVKKILLVEDEPIIAMLETRQLIKEGYAVTHVSTGEKAVEFINHDTDEIDIILFDIDLGQGIDGTEAASEILKNHELPVIFLSSHTEKEIVAKTEKITSYGYVVKNSGIRVLDASIKMACRLFEANRELKFQKQNIQEINEDLQRTVQELQAMNEEIEAANEHLMESEKLIMEKDYLLNLTGNLAKIGGWEFNTETMAGSWTDQVSKIHESESLNAINVDFGLGFYKGESKKEITGAVKNAIENGTPYDLELEMVTALGNRKWIRTIGMPVISGGKVVKVQGTIQDITEQKLLNHELIESEKRFQKIFEESPEGMFIQVNDCFEYLNKAAMEIFGLKEKDELIGRPVIEHFHPDCRDVVRERIKKLNMLKEKFVLIEDIILRIDGTPLSVEVSASPFDSGGKNGAIVFIHDITGRKKAKAELLRINRLYLITSQINQMVVHTKTLDKLFSEVCRITVDTGNFSMAWIGLVDEKTRQVRPSTWAGLEDGYLSIIKQITLNDEPEGKGPTATAIRGGKYFYCNDILNDPCMAPWRQEALKRGYRSSIALPIIIRGKPAGAFNIYSAEPFFFNRTEIQMLEEITVDISYAVEMIDAEKQKEKAEKELRLMVSHREILMKELQHRVKNNLNVISSLLQLEENKSPDRINRDIYLNAQNRIKSMIGIYERLYLSPDLENIDLHQYIKDLAVSIFNTYSIDRGKIRLCTKLEELRLESKRAVPLGLILNELISNALKYAYPDSSEGEISLELKKNGDHVDLRISDNGCGLPETVDPYTSDSMGFTLVRMLAEQIGAELSFENSNGASVNIGFRE